MIRNYSTKGLEKRKSDREGLAEFFIKHIDIIKKNKICCEECGLKLKGDVSEVAHILPKDKFKSIQLEDLNIIYLCGRFGNECHSKFDSTADVLNKMSVFNNTKNKVEGLLKIVKENYNYKILDKWEI